MKDWKVIEINKPSEARAEEMIKELEETLIKVLGGKKNDGKRRK